MSQSFPLLHHLIRQQRATLLNSQTSPSTSQLKSLIKQFYLRPEGDSSIFEYQPSFQEKTQIVQHFHLKGVRWLSDVVSQVRSDLRFEGLRDEKLRDSCIAPTRISASQRRIVMEEFKKFVDKYGTLDKMSPEYTRARAELWKKLRGLSRSQFGYYLRKSQHRRAMSGLTNESKETIRSALVSNQMQPLSKEQKDDLQRLVGCSREQLNAQIRLTLDPPGNMNKESKRKFAECVNANDGKFPTNNAHKVIVQEMTGWSRDQLNKYVHRLKRRSILYRLLHRESHIYQSLTAVNAAKSTTAITDETRTVVKEWFRNSPTGTPTTDEFHALRAQTKWSSHQLSTFLYYLRTTQTQSSPVNDGTKKILRDWLHEHDYRDPNTLEKRELLSLTGWNMHQLNHQLQCERDPPGEVNEETKALLEDWLRTHSSNTPPTKQDKKHLMQLTGWNRKQLNNQLRKHFAVRQHIEKQT